MRDGEEQGEEWRKIDDGWTRAAREERPQGVDGKQNGDDDFEGSHLMCLGNLVFPISVCLGEGSVHDKGGI